MWSVGNPSDIGEVLHGDPAVTGSGLLETVPTELYIGGNWCAAREGRAFEVLNPADGSVLTTVADASPDDGVAALDAAAAAAHDWASTSPKQRGDLLRRAYELLLERAEELAELITLEMGKPLAESRSEVAYAAEFLRWFSEEAVRISGGYATLPEGTGRMLISQRPVGPCYLITPWNFPLAMATRKIAPALAAGCTVVVKPSELTPLTTLFFVRILEAAGLGAGVVNVITTTSAPEVSDAIMRDSRLRKVSFTGSTAVGRSLMAQAAHNVLRLSLELGGNAPFIVFEDADLDVAVSAALSAKLRNIGQACTAANRFLVHRSLAPAFTQRLAEAMSQLEVGSGLNPGVSIGPMISRHAAERVSALIQDAVDRGARLRLGGRMLDGPGAFLEPTLVTHVPREADITRQEIFGPVVAIAEFEDEEEAVQAANDTEYGLAAYVFTQDLARTHRLVDRLATGMMGVNVGVISNAAAPFGGIGHSGFGREGGSEGIKEYLSTKYTLLGG